MSLVLIYGAGNYPDPNKNNRPHGHKKSTMKIKINESNGAALTAALATANGRARTHTFNGESPIIAAAVAAEAKLELLGLTKRGRKGAIAHVSSGGSLPTAYKYPRITSLVTLTRGADAWFVISITARESWDRSTGGTYVFLTPEQDRIATEKFRAQYGKQAAVAPKVVLV